MLPMLYVGVKNKVFGPDTCIVSGAARELKAHPSSACCLRDFSKSLSLNSQSFMDQQPINPLYNWKPMLLYLPMSLQGKVP